MATYTYAQLEDIWNQAAAGTPYSGQSPIGASWAALMAAIALAESGGDPQSVNPNDSNGKGGTQTSWGLWQISDGTHNPPAANWNNPLINAQLAIGKLQSQGLSAWGTFASGAYKAELSGSTTPDSSWATDATLLAASSTASGSTSSSSSDCAWEVGWGGVLGIGAVHACLISKSQVRGLAGVGLLVAGGLIMFSGVATIAVAAGLSVGSKLLGVAPVGRISRLAGGAKAARAAPAAPEVALAA